MRRTVHHRSPYGLPRGTSGYKDRANPAWTSWSMVTLFAVAFVLLPNVPWVGLLLLFWAVVASARKRGRRAHECEDRGWHDPYRPVEHLPELRCWHCGTYLDPDYERDAPVRRAAEARRQAFYSDRR